MLCCHRNLQEKNQVDFDALLFCFSTSPAHKYYLAVDPVSESLYLSDTNTRKVYKAKSLTETKDLAKNADVVAGTGDQCLPFDQSHCGDGGKAAEASLNSPRGKRSLSGVLRVGHLYLLSLLRNSDATGCTKMCLWKCFNQLLSQITS